MLPESLNVWMQGQIRNGYAATKRYFSYQDHILCKKYGLCDRHALFFIASLRVPCATLNPTFQLNFGSEYNLPNTNKTCDRVMLQSGLHSSQSDKDMIINLDNT